MFRRAARQTHRVFALDPFIPNPDVRERFHTFVHAPAALVLETASNFDLQGLPAVRAIFRMREILMRTPRSGRRSQGLLADTREMGWGVLHEEPGRVVVCGAACQPWEANVDFTPIPARRFARYAEPDRVKIAWTLEVKELGPDVTILAHETRAVATDDEARRKFLRYWRWARFGIIAIRLLLLPAVRRAAEKEYRASRWSALHPSRRFSG